MEPSSTDVLPLLAPELLAATATAEGVRLGSNAAWDAVFGRADLWAHLEPEDRRFAGEYLAEAAAGALVTHQVFLVARHHEDLPAPVLLNFLPVHVPDAAIGTRPVVITGEVLQEPQRWTTDQTKRRRMELLGQMSMGIAHDFNNLLTSILGHVELITSDPHTEPDIHKQLSTVRRAALDGAALVRKIQRYIRHENEQRFALLDLSDLIEEVASLTRPYWFNEPRRQGIAIHLTKSLTPVPPMLGDEAELREVFVNLILNAVQAMPEGGTLTLSTRIDGEDVIAEVRDEGMGMTEATRQRIFEPLFTTKGENGTGMGLPVSYGIVKEHDGAIEVESAPGTGTTFRLSFPARAAESMPVKVREPEQAQGTPDTTAYRLLVVDDESMVRTVTAKLLRLRGHSVEEASGGPEALAKLADHPFDLVVTDLGMPEMSGHELAYRIRQHHPHLGIVLLTGHTDAEDKSANVDVVVKKPFQIDALDTIIHRVLGA